MDAGSLNIVFPKTIEILQEKKIFYLQEQFHKTMREQLQVSGDTDVTRWFPVFLKFQGVRPEILEVAEFEYLRHFTEELDEGRQKLDPEQLALNPSAQFVELHYHQPKLNRSAGLYCFFKKENLLSEYRLSLLQALVIDLLHEERKYSLDQLALNAAIHEMGASQDLQKWKETILEMMNQGLLVTAMSSIYENVSNSEPLAIFKNNNKEFL